MTRVLLACYARLVFLYPKPFRERYGRELQLVLRDYARDNSAASVLLFLFSDLLLSLPREYAREVGMKLNRRTIAGAAGGAFLIAMAVIMVVQDIQNSQDRMGFFATLVMCTLGLAGAVLLTFPLRPGPRFLWLIPATYAAAAATWVMITPFFVQASAAPLRSALFRLGAPGAIGFLYLPVLIALLPIMRAEARMPATILLIAFALLFSFILGPFYVPAAIAMLLVRIANAPPAGVATPA